MFSHPTHLTYLRDYLHWIASQPQHAWGLKCMEYGTHQLVKFEGAHILQVPKFSHMPSYGLLCVGVWLFSHPKHFTYQREYVHWIGPPPPHVWGLNCIKHGTNQLVEFEQAHILQAPKFSHMPIIWPTVCGGVVAFTSYTLQLPWGVCALNFTPTPTCMRATLRETWYKPTCKNWGGPHFTST